MSIIKCLCNNHFFPSKNTFIGIQEIGNNKQIELHNCPVCKSTRSYSEDQEFQKFEHDEFCHDNYCCSCKEEINGPNELCNKCRQDYELWIQELDFLNKNIMNSQLIIDEPIKLNY